MTPMCPECGESMTKYEAPAEVFRMRLWRSTALVVVRDEVGYSCVECDSDRASRPFNDAYRAGCEDGYQRGREDAITEDR